MKNLADKTLGFVLGVVFSAFICAMLIFTGANPSWFELVKTLSTLLVAGAFIVAALTYTRQASWREAEDSLEDSKIFCEASIDGLQKAAEKVLGSFKGVDWHIASVHLEETSIVARNITNQSVRDIYNLKKSVIFNEVLDHVYNAKQSDFSGLNNSQYESMKLRVDNIAQRDISSLAESEKKHIADELISYADTLRESNSIDISSIVEVCISCSLHEHDDVFEKEMINRSYGEISPDYLEPEVLSKAIEYINAYFSSSSLSLYIEFLNSLSTALMTCSIDRRDQLIGN